MTAPLVHLTREPRSKEGLPPLVVLLHGVGSNEADLFDLEGAFAPEFRVVSARAPLAMGPRSFAWFPVQFTPTGPVADVVQAEASRVRLAEFVSWCINQGADPARVYLVGFSQGAIMAASLGLIQPHLVAGAVLMSGRILAEVLPQAVPRPEVHPRYLVVHGTDDERLPLFHGQASRQTLIDLGLEPEYREFAMGHTVTDDSLGYVAMWVNRLAVGHPLGDQACEPE